MAADLVVTAAQVAVVDPGAAEIYDFVAGATITAGQAVYLASTGKVGLADANGTGTRQFRGIALNGAGAGGAVSVLKRGRVHGFTISALAYDAIAYLSDTVGALNDTASSTLTVHCGRVVALSDSDLTKVLYVEADWLRTWA